MSDKSHYCWSPKRITSWWGERMTVRCFKHPGHEGKHEYAHPEDS